MNEPDLPYMLPRENVQEINRLDLQHVLLSQQVVDEKWAYNPFEDLVYFW